MLLARRPRPLGGRISGEGGDGDLLGERGHGMVEICSTAVYRLFLELWVAEVEVEVEVEGVRMRGRPLLRLRLPPPVRKLNLVTIVETRLRRDRDKEDWELDEIVEGECLRLGLGESLRASRVGRGAARGKAARIKEGDIIGKVLDARVTAENKERDEERERRCRAGLPALHRKVGEKEMDDENGKREVNG